MAAVLLIAAAVCAAAEIKIPRSPDQWVTDTAGFLSAEAVGRINARLRAYEAESGHQILVYVAQSTGGYPIEEYAVRAFKAWAPGRKGLDDGLVLFVMADDRKMRIEVGYGLEDKVTDAQAARIINNVLAPKFRAGDRDGGIEAAVSGDIPSPLDMPTGCRFRSRCRFAQERCAEDPPVVAVEDGHEARCSVLPFRHADA